MLPTESAPQGPKAEPGRRFGSIVTRPGRPGYYVKWAWGGERYRRFGGATRKAARAKLVDLEALRRNRATIDEALHTVFSEVTGSRMTFREAWDSYLEHAKTRKRPSTIAADKVRARLILAAPWSALHLADVEPGVLTRWAHDRTKARKMPFRKPKPKLAADGTPLPPASKPKRRRRRDAKPLKPKRDGRMVEVTGPTINRDLALVSAVFSWAARMGYVETNPARQVERFSEAGRAREVYLSAEESRALVRAACASLRPVLVCALSTGMRRGELLALRWGCVDFGRRVLVVEAKTEKAGKGRVVPMSADLYAELSEVKAGARSINIDGKDPVFRGPSGKPLSASRLRAGFDSALAACRDIPKERRDLVCLHSLRHTAASLMVAASVPLFDVAKILGHSTLAVTMRYAHFAPEAGRMATDRLGAALALRNGQSESVVGAARA